MNVRVYDSGNIAMFPASVNLLCVRSHISNVNALSIEGIRFANGIFSEIVILSFCSGNGISTSEGIEII